MKSNIDPKAFEIIKVLGKENSESLSDVCELMHEASSHQIQLQLEIESLKVTVLGFKTRLKTKQNRVKYLEAQVRELRPCEAFDDESFDARERRKEELER
jgi:predicted RNase H-like nuclease (RuvC/YqgF family)|tara:strand:- start:474 stop:773 length:300 start_codon:yes stop_codon:yes gene_type:complete